MLCYFLLVPNKASTTGDALWGWPCTHIRQERSNQQPQRSFPSKVPSCKRGLSSVRGTDMSFLFPGTASPATSKAFCSYWAAPHPEQAGLPKCLSFLFWSPPLSNQITSNQTKPNQEKNLFPHRLHRTENSSVQMMRFVRAKTRGGCAHPALLPSLSAVVPEVPKLSQETQFLPSVSGSDWSPWQI